MVVEESWNTRAEERKRFINSCVEDSKKVYSETISKRRSKKESNPTGGNWFFFSVILLRGFQRVLCNFIKAAMNFVWAHLKVFLQKQKYHFRCNLNKTAHIILWNTFWWISPIKIVSGFLNQRGYPDEGRRWLGFVITNIKSREKCLCNFLVFIAQGYNYSINHEQFSLNKGEAFDPSIIAFRVETETS